MKKIVTREAVAAAIQQITERGNKPTIERIRAITGGSPKTISIIKNAIENGNNGILDGTDDHDTLPLFNDNDNMATSLSYHKITRKVDDMIMKRLDNIVMRRIDTVLSRLEGTPQNQNDHDPNDPNETEAKATSLKLENEGLVEALGEMRALWIEAVDQLSEARQDVTTLTKDFAQLEKSFQTAQKELLMAGTRIAEGEERSYNSYNDKGERVFKSELALAVRHLVMTVGMSQKEVGELLGLNANEVSQLKNRGTKLHQQRAKS